MWDVAERQQQTEPAVPIDSVNASLHSSGGWAETERFPRCAPANLYPTRARLGAGCLSLPEQGSLICADCGSSAGDPRACLLAYVFCIAWDRRRGQARQMMPKSEQISLCRALFSLKYRHAPCTLPRPPRAVSRRTPALAQQVMCNPVCAAMGRGKRCAWFGRARSTPHTR